MNEKQMKGMGLAQGGYAEGGQAKKGVMIGILARLKKPENKAEGGEVEETPAGEAEFHETHKAAADEMISAVHNKDAAALMKSMKNFMEALRLGSTAEAESEKDYESGDAGEGYAEGGMPKKKVMAAHEAAKKAMPQFQKEYGAEKGKQVAYATMMKREKMK